MEDTYRSQFRLPQSLYEKLKTSAESSGRPLNTELVRRLEASFDAPVQPTRAADLLQEIVDQQRTVAMLIVLLQDAVDLMEDHLPDDLRQDADFSSFINQAEGMIYEYRRQLRAHGSKK